MICPYIVHRSVVTQNTSEFDSEDRETGWQQVQRNTATPMECQKENCAAWQDGKCCYRGE